MACDSATMKRMPPALHDLIDKAQQDKAAWERLCIVFSWGLVAIAAAFAGFMVYRFICIFITGA